MKLPEWVDEATLRRAFPVKKCAKCGARQVSFFVGYPTPLVTTAVMAGLAENTGCLVEEGQPDAWWECRRGHTRLYRRTKQMREAWDELDANLRRRFAPDPEITDERGDAK